MLTRVVPGRFAFTQIINLLLKIPTILNIWMTQFHLNPIPNESIRLCFFLFLVFKCLPKRWLVNQKWLDGSLPCFTVLSRYV
ncbi:hypothetical protein BLOT_012391 [Blomia tropicalis]|nr:hypothetical protein BLOT_012391 [Blomia tropicalis]